MVTDDANRILYGGIRLNPDGSLDSTFVLDPLVGGGNSLAFQSDGKILMGTHNSVARLMGDSASVPVITQQPQSQSVMTGSNTTFAVSIGVGMPPFDYQWRFNGASISGAKASSYEITNAQPTTRATTWL